MQARGLDWIDDLTVGLLVCMPTVALLAVAGVAVLPLNRGCRVAHRIR